MASAELRAHREAAVREYMESENVHDFDPTIGRAFARRARQG